MVPSNPSDRLDVTEREIYGIEAAVKLLLPALKEHAAMMGSVDMPIIERQKFQLFQLRKLVRLQLQ
jgi:hypothetical protein